MADGKVTPGVTQVYPPRFCRACGDPDRGFERQGECLDHGACDPVPVITAENSPVALASSAFYRPHVPTPMTDAPCFAVPGDTPLVHSTLLEMIGFAATGRCMACGWTLQRHEERGVGSCLCEQGNCSFRPNQDTPEYPRWWQRTQILTLARKYLKGELGKDAAAEAGR